MGKSAIKKKGNFSRGSPFKSVLKRGRVGREPNILKGHSLFITFDSHSWTSLEKRKARARLARDEKMSCAKL